MECVTVRKGTDCVFMTREGCSFDEGECHPVVEQCAGCDYIRSFPTGEYCAIYAEPASRWALGDCAFATHLDKTKGAVDSKLNPVKASRRSMKG